MAPGQGIAPWSVVYKTAALLIELTRLVGGMGIEPISAAYETAQFTRTVTSHMVPTEGFEPPTPYV